jgi:hypothetical protein
MLSRKVAWVCAGALVFASMLAAQMQWRVYRSLEGYDNVPVPSDYNIASEWVQARLMYPPHPNARFTPRAFGMGQLDWREGGTSWSQDYPRADRHFAQALRRLTRLSVRSVEQPVNLDDGDDVYNWPWLVAGEMGDWKLTDAQATKLRDYLLRGGFIYMDDFWNTVEWQRFDESMSMVFPDRPIVDLPNKEAIFHTVYDLDDRYQIPGTWALGTCGPISNQFDRWVGTTAQWKGIYDDHNRLMVAISFNSDVGDSWEWADAPCYPEKYSALGIRIGVNYVTYDLTH